MRDLRHVLIPHVDRQQRIALLDDFIAEGYRMGRSQQLDTQDAGGIVTVLIGMLTSPDLGINQANPSPQLSAHPGLVIHPFSRPAHCAPFGRFIMARFIPFVTD
jgi:hypothetical protein